ncbi:predicted protein [Plenodomus lingam JN3]|uniref:Predicted protein n=2 Tax=Leptosphaeria maculans TaxID=5022 RepID=E5R4H1_LEPMJ|nr:predicted protein [Plenodomus lingam JN3]CBX91939.1 predicted protein [Plenodomus lingam JN3]
MPLSSRASAQVGAGDFSKPRVHQRSRRDKQGSRGPLPGDEEETGGMPFRYYGRHSNQWLFNDFSIGDAVGRGFKRVFGREKGEEDWLERREK